jgi:antitoxin YefM
MKSTSCTELRRNLAAAIDHINSDHEPIFVTRRGKPSAVLMSFEDFASDEETWHLMTSPRNAERLLRSIADLDAG